MGFSGAQPFPRIIERTPGTLIEEARAAYNAGLFIACLTVLVTIPDVCSHLMGSGGKDYRSWCETYLGLDSGCCPKTCRYITKCKAYVDKPNRSSEQTNEEINRALERLMLCSAFTSSDLSQLRNAMLHTGSSKVAGSGAKFSQYHSIGVYVTDSGDSLVCSYGVASHPTTDDIEEDCRFEAVISLTGLLSLMELGVQRFLGEFPECDREYGKDSSLHWGIVDMRTVCRN